MVNWCATIRIVTDFDISSGASARLTDVIGLGVLIRLIDRDTVDEVLARADRRETRVRLLPARVVVYLVLALCRSARNPNTLPVGNKCPVSESASSNSRCRSENPCIPTLSPTVTPATRNNTRHKSNAASGHRIFQRPPSPH